MMMNICENVPETLQFSRELLSSAVLARKGEIGRVKLVQVQPTPLKIGGRPKTYYDPSPLLVVDTLLVSPSGSVRTNDSVFIPDTIQESRD